jgi:hypothetical protein
LSDWDQELWDRISGDEPDSAWDMIYERVNEVLSQPPLQFVHLVPENERTDFVQDCMERFVRDDLVGRLREHTGELGQLKWLIAQDILNVVHEWRLDRGRELKCEPLIEDESPRSNTGQ